MGLGSEWKWNTKQESNYHAKVSSGANEVNSSYEKKGNRSKKNYEQG